MSDSFWPHGLQHARLPCPSSTPRAYTNSCPSSRWCHLTISSSLFPFSSYLQSFPASGSFLLSQFFTSGGQSIGASASASVLPMNIQDWFPLGLTGLISLQSKRLLRVFLNTTVPHLYVEPEKKKHNNTNKLIYKAVTILTDVKKKLMVTKGESTWRDGINIYTILY